MPVQARTEEELIAASLVGDQEAYAVIVQRYQDGIYNLAYRFLGDREEARDAAQDAFWKAYEALPRFRHGASFSTWLYRIATNACLDRLRRRRAVPMDRVPDEADPQPGPEGQAENSELVDRVRAALAGLPEKYRVLVVLSHYQGCSYQEMVEITGLPLTVVKNRLYRAREMLRRQLADLAPGIGG